jgi:hypothetical protein
VAGEKGERQKQSYRQQATDSRAVNHSDKDNRSCITVRRACSVVICARGGLEA